MIQILILGISGFLGTALARHLASCGVYVMGLIRQEASAYPRLAHSHIKLHPFSEYKSVIKNESIDSIVNCMVLYDRPQFSMEDLFEVNVQLPLQCVEVVACKNRPCRVINVETILPVQTNRYTQSKSQLTQRLLGFQPLIQTTHVALDYVYGPFDHPQKLIPSVMHACMNQVPQLSFTKGLQQRRFIYIDDCVRAFQKILQQPLSLAQVRYEVGGNESVTLRTFIETLRECCQPTCTQLHWGALPYRENEVFQTQVSVTAIQKLGWHAQVDITEGIQKMVALEKEK